MAIGASLLTAFARIASTEITPQLLARPNLEGLLGSVSGVAPPFTLSALESCGGLFSRFFTALYAGFPERMEGVRIRNEYHVRSSDAHHLFL